VLVILSQKVAPCKGAWIEIMRLNNSGQSHRSHPVRVRGLKCLDTC